MRKVLVVATSLDGYIAQSREQVSTAWTSREDRRWFGQISRRLGVVIMGAPTYQTIGHPLADRQLVVLCEPGEWPQLPEVADFRRGGAAVYRSSGRPLADVCACLEAAGVDQLLVGGGARVYQSFLRERLVDELYVTLEPVLLGGGIKLTAGAAWPAPMPLEVIEKIELLPQTSVWHLRVPPAA